jgi:hypothetical protein
VEHVIASRVSELKLHALEEGHKGKGRLPGPPGSKDNEIPEIRNQKRNMSMAHMMSAKTGNPKKRGILFIKLVLKPPVRKSKLRAH